jgi:hypothetical protein
MVGERCAPYPRQVCPADDQELKFLIINVSMYIRYREGVSPVSIIDVGVF